MEWLDKAVALAKEFEGCRLEAYPDPVYGWRVATVGYGATGPAIAEGTAWTQEQADADLTYRMTGIGQHVDLLVKTPISDEQKAALCDLAYNIGLGALERSTLLTCVNANHMQGAADQFMVWTKSDGVELEGLVKRRDAERALFLLGANLSGESPPGESQSTTEVQS
ncbi:lysozyme [Pararobbsia alpina]|uniref:lysozyme n=1 Tax=Pararobbsia alpina TaxID=621374 RepID=UPI0039A6DBDC